MKKRNDIRATDDIYDENIDKAHDMFEKVKLEGVEMRLVRSADDYSKGYWIEFPPYSPLGGLDYVTDQFKP